MRAPLTEAEKDEILAYILGIMRGEDPPEPKQYDC